MWRSSVFRIIPNNRVKTVEYRSRKLLFLFNADFCNRSPQVSRLSENLSGNWRPTYHTADFFKFCTLWLNFRFHEVSPKANGVSGCVHGKLSRQLPLNFPLTRLTYRLLLQKSVLNMERNLRLLYSTVCQQQQPALLPDWNVTQLFGMMRKNEIHHIYFFIFFIFFVSGNMVTIHSWWKIRIWVKRKKKDIKKILSYNLK